MTCRHSKFDPNCSSFNSQVKNAISDYQMLASRGIAQMFAIPQAPTSQMFAMPQAPTSMPKPTTPMAPQAIPLPTPAPATPDASDFEIEDWAEVDGHLVLRVRYPSCARCSYEGVKVMVLLDACLKDAVKWRVIDPHFRDTMVTDRRTAPAPAARFPASEEGWQDAISFAKSRAKKK